MNILVLDNYDSFTYNLVHYIKELVTEPIDVYRNDAISLEEVDKYDTIILSPGPSLPKDAGILIELIKKYASTKKILGVCLGQQAIAEAFGGQLRNLKEVYHGLATPITIIKSDEVLFKNMPNEVEVGRYHSWVVEVETLPTCLEVTAVDEAGDIMALRHKNHDIHAVQFHPESVLTPLGKQMIKNFLEA